jgi:hypothetical protein
MVAEVRIYSKQHALRMERKMQEADGQLSNLRKASQKKRWKNFKDNLFLLHRENIEFMVSIPNQGLCQIWHMEGNEERTTDLYATTGYWKCRETQKHGRGTINMANYIKKLERRVK